MQGMSTFPCHPWLLLYFQASNKALRRVIHCTNSGTMKLQLFILNLDVLICINDIFKVTVLQNLSLCLHNLGLLGQKTDWSTCCVIRQLIRWIGTCQQTFRPTPSMYDVRAGEIRTAERHVGICQYKRLTIPIPHVGRPVRCNRCSRHKYLFFNYFLATHDDRRLSKGS